MIRPATPADAAAVLDVMFATAMSRESSWWRNTVDGLARKLAEGGGFVALDDGRAVGCVGWVVDDDGTLNLRGLAVRPDHEGRGLGARLVGAVEDVARGRGLPEVLLAVSRSNLTVLGFYERLGYGVSERPYRHAVAGRPAPVVMVRRLA